MRFAEMEEIRASLEKNGQQSTAVKEVQYLAGDTIVHMGNVTPVTQEELKQGLEELVELGVLCQRAVKTGQLRANENQPL
jgi:hypothetical protein